MKPYEIAARNVRRRIRHYLAFLFSNAFSTMIFFTFLSLYMSEEVTNQLGSSPRIHALLKISAILVALFAVVFLWYSAALFLKQRKRELGTCLLSGMEQRQLARILVLEHAVLGAIASAVGVLIGMVFLRVFSMLLAWLMHFQGLVRPGISFSAVAISFGAFLLLHLLAGFGAAGSLYRFRLIDLIKDERMVEKRRRVSWMLVIIGVAGIGLGYGLVLDPYRDRISLNYLIEVLVITIAGTYALFGGGLSGPLNALKRRAIRHSDGVGILAYGELAFRVRKNSRLLATVAVFNAISITAAGTFFSFYSDYEDGMRMLEQDAPRAFTFAVDNAAEADRMLTEAADMSETSPTRSASITLYHPTELLPVSSTGEGTPPEARTVDAIISYADLIALGITPKGESVHEKPVSHLFIQRIPDGLSTDALERALGNSSVSVETVDGEVMLPIAEVAVTPLFSPRLLGGFALLVVPDLVAARLDGERFDAASVGILDYADPESTLEVHHYLASQRSITHMDSWIELYLLLFGGLGLMLFVGTFIGITLIMANGSILFFRQLMEAVSAKPRYTIARHIGFTAAQIRRSIQRQLAVVFSVPFAVGLVHALVALILLKKLTGVDIWRAHAIVVCAYLVIYAGFYLLNTRSYRRLAGIK